jgi:hypothetical protein
MKIVQELPPHFDRVQERFGILPRGVIFCWGDTIYSPGQAELPEHIIVHEAVHCKQQENTQGGIEAWWNLYLIDDEFRLSQEVEAYQAQWAYLCENADRGERRRILKQICKDLSGQIYGRLISKDKAKELITGE